MVDCVILAAGNGTRLRGVVAQGLKSLVLIDGEALIVRLVRQATEAKANRIVIVVSPTNAAHIIDVVESAGHDQVRYVVQPHARGPGEALRRGLEACEASRVLVLLGDNVIENKDVAIMAECESTTVGVRLFKPSDTTLEGLTRRLFSDVWVEKVPLQPGEETGTAWTGLMLVDRTKAWLTLVGADAEMPEDQEVFIGPYIGDFDTKVLEVPVTTFDIGTPS